MDSAATGRRRGLRKGTRSCWECKRRKTRCIFNEEPATSTVCTGCQRRGLACVSQEFPEAIARPTVPYQPLNERLVRVEKLLGEIAAKSDTGVAPSELSDIHNATPAIGFTPGISACISAAGDEREIDHTSLNRNPAGGIPTGARERPEKLQSALPTPEDMSIIAQVVSQDALYYHMMMAIPYTQAKSSSKALDSLASLPDLTSHPVLIAKRLLIIATFLQGMAPEHKSKTMHLSMPVDVMKVCLIDMARCLVEARDDQIKFMEEMECILLEAVFHANCGDLRRCWLAFRRLIAVGQLLGMHRSDLHLIQFLDTENAADPGYMYFQIVYMERVLCLLLGQPQGSPGRHMMTLIQEDPVQRMEYLHSSVASQILSRNEEGLCYQDFSATQKIDREMQKVAGMVSQDWWLVPDLSAKSDRVKGFCQLSTHLMHHYLLMQLHLPFILPSPTEVRQDYSIFTCVHASREVLTRFIAFRCMNSVTFNFSALYFFALIAIEAILLAHINSRRFKEFGDILAHQRASDRAIATKVLEHIDKASQVCPEVRYRKSADVLRQLLQIEDEAYEECGLASNHTQSLADNVQHGLRVSVPFFGIVIVTRQGVLKSQGIGTADFQGFGPETLSSQVGQQENIDGTLLRSRQHEPLEHPSTMLDSHNQHLLWGQNQTNVTLNHSDFLMEEAFQNVDPVFLDSVTDIS